MENHRPAQSARYRSSIREAIARRLADGKPLTVRDIRNDAGGGSNTTVLEEIRLATEGRAFGLSGNEARSEASVLGALRAAARDANNRCDILRREVESRNETIALLEKALEAASSPKGLLLDRFSVFEAQMRERSDQLVKETQKLLVQTMRIARAFPQGSDLSAGGTSASSSPQVDALTQARMQRLVKDLSSLTEKHNKLKSRFFQETGMDPDDELS